MPNQPAATGAKPLSNRLSMLILLLVSLGLYANTLGNGFVMDDLPIFEKHRFVNKGIAGIPEILSTPYWFGYTSSTNALYRPLPLVLIAAERELFGISPLAAHAINMLLYAACVLLLYRFLIRLFGESQRLFALLASLLFAVLPVHTEVGAYAKSCDELMSFAFLMLALTALLRYWDSGRPGKLAAAIALYFLALLSKESALFVVLIAPLLAVRYRDTTRSRAILGSSGMILAAAVFLGIRHVVLQAHETAPFQVSIGDNSLAGIPDMVHRLANSIMLLGHYLKLLFIPHPLIYDYSYTTLPLVSWSDAGVWLALVLYLGLLGFGIFRVATRRGDRIGLGILFYLAGIALFSNFVLLLGVTFAERFLFTPSVGFCIAVAALIIPANQSIKAAWSRPGIVVAALAILVFTGMTISRNADWKDEETLYSVDIEKAPENYRIPYNLATAKSLTATGGLSPELRSGVLREVIVYLHQSIAAYNRFSPAFTELGAVYKELGNADSAFYYSNIAVAMDPRDTFSRNNIAAFHFQAGNYHEAIRLSRENLKFDPNSRQPYANIGACYLKLNRPDSAIPPLQRAWQLDPGNQRTGYFLNVAFSMNAQPDSAQRYAAFTGNRR